MKNNQKSGDSQYLQRTYIVIRLEYIQVAISMSHYMRGVARLTDLLG